MKYPQHPVLRLLLAGSMLLTGPVHGATRTASQKDCDDTTCYLLFREALNFTDAVDTCSAENGNLAALPQSFNKFNGLMPRSNERFWIGLALPDGLCPDKDSATYGYEWITGGASSAVYPWARVPDICDHRCVSMSADGLWRQEPCGGTLDGFLCTAMPECRASERLAVPGAHNVSSGSTHAAWSPVGAIWSTSGEKDARYVDAKWLCAWRQWWPAPWNCGVLAGGCSHTCQKNVCTCPEGQVLHANNVTCVVNECSDAASCPGLHTTCEKQPGGGAKCACQKDFEADEDGACLDLSICMHCEHKCVRAGSVRVCACHAGFRVSEKDPTLCVPDCDQPVCPAYCHKDQCRCPAGYILDERSNASLCVDMDECHDADPCGHACLNTQGSYTCTCRPGYQLVEDGDCKVIAMEETSALNPRPSPITTTTGATAVAVPSYVRVGAALGMTVFVAMALALLYLLLRAGLRRCSAVLEVSSLRGADLDTLTLQQVTTQKYQRFSFDKQNGTDGQRL